MDQFAAFRALSFDCYGTLIDWESGLAAALEPWSAAHDVRATEEELIELVARHETLVQSERPSSRYPDVLSEVLGRVAREVGADASTAERAAFGASVGRWPAFDDSAAALARLHERFALVILSNVDRASFAASNDRLGVKFDLVITAEDVGSYKPSARNFTALLDGVRSLGFEPTELLHVAQSLFHDHEPALRAGLDTVWIDRRHDKPGFGATPAPTGTVRPRWRFESMAAFAEVVAR